MMIKPIQIATKKNILKLSESSLQMNYIFVYLYLPKFCTHLNIQYESKPIRLVQYSCSSFLEAILGTCLS